MRTLFAIARGLAFFVCLAGACLSQGATAEGASPAPGAAAPGVGPLLSPDRIKTDTLVVLAHPDDEGVVAPYVARLALDEGKQVVHLYLTAGEFGTDRAGAVRGPAFSFLRLTELHWTLDRLGVAMFQSLGRSDLAGADDPGKILDSWDRPSTLRELVRLIRLMRPEEILTWFPGPPSSHVDHMAAGGATLLAAREAADPSASPEQMQTEGLRPWKTPSIRLFFQAEKVGYDRYPDPPQASAGVAGLNLSILDLDGVSPSQRRRYTDIARDAMREQRAVGVGMGLARGGPFDEPLRLIGISKDGEAAATAAAPAGVRISLEPAGAQRFLEDLAKEIGAPGLARLFPPEVRLPAGGPARIAARVTCEEGRARSALASLKLPTGWPSGEKPQRVTLEAGSSAEIGFALRVPEKAGATYAPAEIALVDESGRQDLARIRIVLRVVKGEAPPPE